MPVLETDEVALHFETSGDGPPLLLIPGLLSDNASWAPVMEPLGRHYSLILPDPRGAGRTEPKTAALTLDALAKDMLALATHLRHERFAVAGHSLGALVALTMAALAPHRLTHLVALASTPLPSARLPTIFAGLCDIRERAGDESFFRALFPWLFADAFFRDPDAVDTAVRASLDYPHLQSPAAMRHQTRALARLDLKSMADSLAMPTLVLLGEEDPLITPGPAQEAWRLRGAEVATIPRTAHSLHWDAPDAVAARIVAFLDRS